MAAPAGRLVEGGRLDGEAEALQQRHRRRCSAHRRCSPAARRRPASPAAR
jgi:hypothetical protein